MKYKHNRLDYIATIVDMAGAGMCDRTIGTSYVIYLRNDDPTHMVEHHIEFQKNWTLIKSKKNPKKNLYEGDKIIITSGKYKNLRGWYRCKREENGYYTGFHTVKLVFEDGDIGLVEVRKRVIELNINE